jgi:AcrR family transcriptional regulator
MFRFESDYHNRNTFRSRPVSSANPTRSDAARNRETILLAATRAFTEAQDEPTMRAIARDSGVGIGTLYRHFPTREALVAAVYADTLARLLDGAADLLNRYAPAEAMRRWMDLFADWVATKMGMLSTMLAMIEAGDINHDESGRRIRESIDLILVAGAVAGDIRSDAGAEDVTASLIGILTVAGSPAQAERLLDLLMDGLRPRAR